MKRSLISSDLIFRGQVFDVTRDQIYELSGQTIIREVVQHTGGAGGLPVFADGKIALVRQYRHPTQKELLEIPAGKVDAGEDPLQCAAREIEEEIGYRAGKLQKLTEFYSTPGFCAEKLFIYLATDLIPSAQKLDHDEELSIVYMTLAEAEQAIQTGVIEDAKTIIALLLARQWLYR